MAHPPASETNYVWRALELFAEHGDADAMVYQGRHLSYRQLHAGVLAMATALHRHGMRPGGAMAALAGTPPEAVMLQLALHMLGCRAVWIAPNAPRADQAGYLRRGDVDAFTYDARSLATLGAELAAGIDRDIPVFCFGEGNGTDLTTVPAADRPPVSPGEVPNEPQSVFQTGGTTGYPKMVRQPHLFFQTLLALSDAYLAAGEHQIRHYAASGFWHVSGQVPTMMTLLTGGTLYANEGFDIGEFLAAVERDRITDILLAPPLLYCLLDDPRLATTDTSSLKRLSCGGSATAPARAAQAIEKLGPVLRPVYGMTEAAFITAYPGIDHDPEHPERLGSCGLPYGDVRIEIRDATGERLTAGHDGDVWVSSSLMMDGYWTQPDLTRATLVDGWLNTGDVGHLDEDGYLYLVDRTRDMIITGAGSTNVYCRPIEDALLAHPGVRAAAAVGVPDRAMGEAVHACVVIAPGAEVSADDLREFVTAQLNPVWAPRTVEFVDELPLTAVGKIDKKAIRARYAVSAAPAAPAASAPTG
ncbi:MAG: AMP-binding protein [Actinocatenispora sp.]